MPVMHGFCRSRRNRIFDSFIRGVTPGLQLCACLTEMHLEDVK